MSLPPASAVLILRGFCAQVGEGLGEINPVSRKLATHRAHQDGAKAIGKGLIL